MLPNSTFAFYLIISFIILASLISIVINLVFNSSGHKVDRQYKEIPYKYKPKRELTSNTDVPSYQDIADGEGGIWDCGENNYGPDEAMCVCDPSINKNIQPGSIEANICNPYATKYTPWYSVCCQSVEGCRPKGLFNWIIGTCNGDVGKANGICDASPYKSQMIINYVGSYEYDESIGKFVCQQESSFNMDGRHAPYDTSKVYGGLGGKDKSWLPGPLPGGAANWKQGFYPAGCKGVGAPAMMFVISVNKMSNSCWYVLNQSDLDRGPAGHMDASLCKAKILGNTWGCNASGEFDLIEPPCVGKFADSEYVKGFATGMSPYNIGQYSGCLFWSEGIYGGSYGGGGWGNSTKYFTMDKDTDAETSRIFVAVIDQMGMRVYQVPGKNSESYWPGIRINSIDMVLDVGPIVKPGTSPCLDKTAFCATFSPFCPIEAKNPEDYDEWHCTKDGRDRGFCRNWVHDKLVYLGPKSLWGTDGNIPTVNGKKIGSWNADMESKPSG